MYNIKELEDEWKRYRNKKRRPFFIGLLLLFFAGVAVAVFMNFSSLELFLSQKTSQKSIPSPKSVPDIKINPLAIDGPITVLENKPVAIKPETPLVDVIPEDNNHKDEESESAKKPLKLKVTDMNDPKAYEAIEKRFQLGHDADDSLFLAKTYYAKGNYKKAEYWALQTNRINDEIEESWIIFVKAKLKSGHKNEALKILNRHIRPKQKYFWRRSKEEGTSISLA